MKNNPGYIQVSFRIYYGSKFQKKVLWESVNDIISALRKSIKAFHSKNDIALDIVELVE